MSHCIWITGLPGAGKTTIAKVLLRKMREIGHQTILLDGDEVRKALQNFEYDPQSRLEIAKTYGRLAKMFSEQGANVICATVSMFDEVRSWNAESMNNYFEVYIKVAPEVLMSRNQKKLYSGTSSTPISAVVEQNPSFKEPINSDLVLNNDDAADIGTLADMIYASLVDAQKI